MYTYKHHTRDVNMYIVKLQRNKNEALIMHTSLINTQLVIKPNFGNIYQSTRSCTVTVMRNLVTVQRDRQHFNSLSSFVLTIHIGVFPIAERNRCNCVKQHT